MKDCMNLIQSRPIKCVQTGFAEQGGGFTKDIAHVRSRANKRGSSGLD